MWQEGQRLALQLLGMQLGAVVLDFSRAWQAQLSRCRAHVGLRLLAGLSHELLLLRCLLCWPHWLTLRITSHSLHFQNIKGYNHARCNW